MTWFVIVSPLLAALITMFFRPLNARRVARVILSSAAAAMPLLLVGKVDWLSFLFAGIVFGHFHLTLPPETLGLVRDLGLILFVYTIGLQVGSKLKGVDVDGAAMAAGVHDASTGASYLEIARVLTTDGARTDADLRDLAVYFAAQMPTAGNVPTAPVAAAGKGEALYLGGDPARGIPPCQGCHGADARGTSIAAGQFAAYPLLRAQYSMYLVARLTSFHKNLPDDTTNDFIMGGVAQTLDEESIQAIAAWLSSLTPSRSL